MAPFDETNLLERLRKGDEAAFAEFVDHYGPKLRRLARSYVPDSLADEVVQEAWLGFLGSLDRFEGRSSLKTWLYRILMNTATKRRAREARSVPFSSLGADGADGDHVDNDRFLPPNHPRWPGHWASPPRSWEGIPESTLLSQEVLDVIEKALAGLPRAQRGTLILRDVEGLGAKDVCNLLGVSGTNQRVLLHRARSAVRAALEAYFKDDDESG
ncbi:MAG: RNA polymerase sigma factor [Actinomycetota bacterium]